MRSRKTGIGGLVLCLLAGLAACSWHSTSRIKLRVQVPGVPVSRQATLQSGTGACVFVDILDSTLADRVAGSSNACWLPADVSDLVWRAGSDVVSVPVSTAPGANKTIKVYVVNSSNATAANCHGPIESLLFGANVIEYASVVANVYAGATIDVQPPATGATLTPLASCDSGAQITSLSINTPVATVAPKGVVRPRAIGTYSDQSSHALLSGVQWSIVSDPNGTGTFIDPNTGYVTGGSSGIGSVTVSASFAGQSAQATVQVRAPNVYIAEPGNYLVRLASYSLGATTLFAGRPGVPGYSGDGEIATSTSVHMYSPNGIAVDEFGNVFVTDPDANAHAIRRIDAETGVITTYSGAGLSTAEGIQAYQAVLNAPAYLLYRKGTGLYVSTGDGLVRLIGTDGKITTVAGGGASVITATDQLATTIALSAVRGLAYDGANDLLYLAQASQIDVLHGDQLRIFLGGSAGCTSGVVSHASATFYNPTGLAWDAANLMLYVSDSTKHTLHAIDSSNSVLVAGACNSTSWNSVTVSGTSARFANPSGLAMYNGLVYIADQGNHHIRTYNTSTTSVVNEIGYASDNSNGSVFNTFTNSRLNTPVSVAIGQ